MLNIKGVEFQNILDFPSVFYNFNHYARQLPSPWSLILDLKAYMSYIENDFQGDRIFVHFCSILPINTFEEGVHKVLDGVEEGKEIMFKGEDNFLYSPFTKDFDWISFLIKYRRAFRPLEGASKMPLLPPLIMIEDHYSQVQFSYNYKRYLNDKHYS